MLGVSPITVRSWVTKGWLKSVNTPGGHRRFLQADLDSFIRERRGIKPPIKLLVVDDDVFFREFLVGAIKASDPSIEIQEAEDGFRAGMMMSEFMPDIVLLDYDMPGLNGAEVCRQIRANPLHAKSRVIGMTGHTSTVTDERLLAAGVDLILHKPFAVKDLMSVVIQFKF